MQHNNCSQRFSQACAVPCGLHRQFVITVTNVIIIILLLLIIITVITVANINSNKQKGSSGQQQIWSFLSFNIGPIETGQSYVFWKHIKEPVPSIQGFLYKTKQAQVKSCYHYQHHFCAIIHFSNKAYHQFYIFGWIHCLSNLLLIKLHQISTTFESDGATNKEI